MPFGARPTGPMGAKAIYQAHLDRVSVMFWGRDYAGAAQAMFYPHENSTHDGRAVVTDPAQVADDMRTCRERLDLMGATDYARRCLDARFDPVDPDRIDGHHRTTILSFGQPLMRPLTTALTLIRRGGDWRCAAMRLPSAPLEMTFLHPDTPRERATSDGDEL